MLGRAGSTLPKRENVKDEQRSPQTERGRGWTTRLSSMSMKALLKRGTQRTDFISMIE